MDTSIMDIHNNASAFSHPYLLILGDKDLIVDNDGALDFYKKTSTPPDKKDLKMFFNCNHQMWKERLNI